METNSKILRKRDADVAFYESKKKQELEYYKNLDVNLFLEELPQPFDLWNMDYKNSLLGVTKKRWWEDYFGKPFNNKTILDIGCGNGYLVPYWALTGNNVVGLDSSETSLKILSTIMKRANLQARLIKGFIEDVQLEEQFDVVSFHNMLHHVENIPKSLEQARNMLKKDGHILIVEPIYYFPFRWAVETDFLANINPLKQYFIRKSEYYEEEKASSRKYYITCIKNAGFKIAHEEYDTNFFGYPLSLLHVRNKKIKRAFFEFDKLLSPFIPKGIKSFVRVIAQPA